MKKIVKDGFIQYVDGALDTINGVGKFMVMVVALLGIVVFGLEACTDLRILQNESMRGNAYVMYDNSCIRQQVHLDIDADRFIMYSIDFDMDVRNLQRVPGAEEKYVGIGKDSEQYTIVFPKDPYIIVQVISQGYEVIVSHKCLPV